MGIGSGREASRVSSRYSPAACRASFCAIRTITLSRSSFPFSGFQPSNFSIFSTLPMTGPVRLPSMSSMLLFEPIESITSLHTSRSLM